MSVRGSILVTVLLSCIGLAHADDLSYWATIDLSKAAQGRLVVTVEFEGDASGETRVAYPAVFRQASNPVDVEPLSADTTIDVNQAAGQALITHKPKALVKVRYELGQGYQGRPASYGMHGYRPLIQEDIVFVTGENALLRPAWVGVKRKGEVAFKGVPSDFKVATSWFRDAAKGPVEAGYEDLSAGVFVAGRIRTLPIGAEGSGVLVTAGKLQIADGDLQSAAKNIFQAEKRLFPWGGPPLNLVVLLPLDGAKPAGVETGGRYYDNSLVAFAQPGAEVGDLQYLLAHEMLHHWLPRQLGKLREPQIEMYWFSEGFTDYLAYQVLLSSAGFPRDRFLRYINRALSTYHRLGLKEVSNADLVKEYFRNNEARRLPYVRGFLLAMRWDYRIRAATDGAKGIADVLPLLRQRLLSGGSLDEASIVASLNALAPGQYAEDVATFVTAGKVIPLEARMVGKCLLASTKEEDQFELGFDEAASVRNRAITGLRKGSAAERAGLVEGMPFRGHSKSYPITTTPVRILFSDGKPTIEYLPVGEGKATVPTLEPIADRAGRLLSNECRD